MENSDLYLTINYSYFIVFKTELNNLQVRCEKHLFDTHFDHIDEVTQTEMNNISLFMLEEEIRRSNDDDFVPRFSVQMVGLTTYSTLVSFHCLFTYMMC